MSNYTMNETDRSLGAIFKELTSHLSTLFRSEVALLKLEVRDTTTKLGGGAAMFAGAVALAIFGAAFLFVTITLGLVALGVPAWLSSLIVTLVLFAGAGVLAFLGKKKFEQLKFPTEAVDHIKADIETIKSDITRARSY